jgi:formylglycine-generating enzyme required for sulfatase activity
MLELRYCLIFGMGLRMKFKEYFLYLLIFPISGCSSQIDQLAPGELESVSNRAQKNLVYVEGGEFFLGDAGDEVGRPFSSLLDNNKPPVKVRLDSYSISKYETTWGDFLTYLRAKGKASEYTLENGFTRAVTLPISANDDPLSPNYRLKPARSPNFSEAEGYCAWLAKQTGFEFALPTEAQWEYAARSRGSIVPYATATGRFKEDPYLQRPSQYIDPATPVSGNALVHSSVKVERRPVGSYPPNPLGIHDMTGNVQEWTRDWYYPDFYEFADRHNPHASEPPTNGEQERSVRDLAGHGNTVGGLDTVFSRSGASLDSPYQGFRCVVNSSKPVN